VFSAQTPAGWSTLTFVGQTQTIFDTADICESCSGAFVVTMTKRKQIASGRKADRELVVNNPPHPNNAKYSPFTKRAVEAAENVG